MAHTTGGGHHNHPLIQYKQVEKVYFALGPVYEKRQVLNTRGLLQGKV